VWSPETDLPQSTWARKGHRFYTAKLGRWINRDPIAEDADRQVPSSCRTPDVDTLGRLRGWFRGRSKAVAGSDRIPAGTQPVISSLSLR
jgi:hypothetical protein